MLRTWAGFFLGMFILATSTLSGMAADEKKVEFQKIANGSVEDQKQAQPAAITSEKGLEAVWKAWKVTGELPKVDFTKQIVVAAYTRGSVLNLGTVQLDEKGNLQVLAISTRDLRPGFRYVLATVNKEGVKTVGGKELPKE